MTTVEALKDLYVSVGGEASDVEGVTLNPDMISAIAAVSGIKDVAVLPEAQSASFWGTAVSAMQSDISVQGNVISGELKYVASGTLVTDWNTHYFIALKFVDPNEADDIKVGSKNLVSLDEDMNAVIALESNEQTLTVKVIKGGIKKTKKYCLSGLNFKEQQ